MKITFGSSVVSKALSTAHMVDLETLAPSLTSSDEELNLSGT